jgi:hypothetical protein
MTTKYNIGTLNEATLATGNPNLGFQVVNGGRNITIQDCINAIKGAELSSQIKSKYVAMSSTATGTGLGMTGKCYKGSNYNPIINPDDTTGTGTGTLFDIYGMPEGACDTVDNCLKGNSKTILDKELKDITDLITANQREKDDVQIRLLAIEKSIPYASAEQIYKNDIEKAELQIKLDALNKKKEALEAHKLSLSARNSEASILLSDKNRLLATVNTNIQQKYTKLEDVNNNINTITQDIYTNNMEMKRKENIIQTLRVILIIIVIMIVILMIYFGMEIIESNSPGSFTNFANKFNGSSLFI